MSGRQRLAKPSMLDRVMARVAPGWGLNRAVSAAKSGAAREVRSSFDAVKKARRSQYWRSGGDDANAALRGNIGHLRAIARDMVRNNAHASRAVNAIVANVVGTGILPQVKGVTKKRATTIEKLIRKHISGPSIDADGLHNLGGLEALAVRTVVVAGEVLIRRRWRRPEDNLPLPFQIQVLEPDFLDQNIDGPLSNGNIAVQGVEFDKIGRRVAYWLFSEHPGASSAYRLPVSNRIPAADVVHIFLADRPGQARGSSWFAPVINRMRDFADYCDAQTVRQKIAACFAAFVTGDADSEAEISGEESKSGYRLEAFEPGMIEYLRQGENVEFSAPPQLNDFGSFSEVTLHEIAAGLNIPYTVLTGNLRGVNFSSGRMGWIEFGRAIEMWRSNMLDPMLFAPLTRWIAEALLLGKGVRDDFELEWIAPRREMIDPGKEIAAAQTAVRAGFSSRSYEQRRFGFDPDDLEAEIKADNDRADELGLIFDSDARKTTVKGSAQSPSDFEPQPADPITVN